MAEEEVKVHVPPSQQLCQEPVPKGGEPVVWSKGIFAPPEYQKKKEEPKAKAQAVEEEEDEEDEPSASGHGHVRGSRGASQGQGRRSK